MSSNISEANRIRVQTALHSCKRLVSSGSILSHGECDSISIHLLGVDEQEICPSAITEMQLSQNYGELLLHLVEKNYTRIYLVFIGPNLDPTLHGHNRSFQFQSSQVYISADTRYYHDFILDIYCNPQPHQLAIPKPTFCILFNAGLWGYDSWRPTLHAFFSPCSALFGIPLVITSYTLEESEDDYDTMDSYVTSLGSMDSASAEIADGTSGRVSLEWLWDCEANPYGGTVMADRCTQPDGRRYFDSHFYQAVVAILIA